MATRKRVKKGTSSKKPADKKKRKVPAASVKEQFQRRLSSKSKGEGLRLTWRVQQAGAEGAFDERLQIEGTGRVRANLLDELGKRRIDQRDIALGAAEIESTLQEILAAVDKMVPREKARFLPDSLVGEVTLEVDDRTERYYFLADEGQARNYKHPRALSAAIRRVREIVSGGPDKGTE